MMKVKYTGEDPILLMHNGDVWHMEKGDDIELDSVPQLPNFEAVKAKLKGDSE